jgi:hypothetical protein
MDKNATGPPPPRTRAGLVRFDECKSASGLQSSIPVVAPVPYSRSLERGQLIAAADRAARGTDGSAFAAAVRRLLPLADDLAIDLVAVIELIPYDVELAALRWADLRRRL